MLRKTDPERGQYDPDFSPIYLCFLRPAQRGQFSLEYPLFKDSIITIDAMGCQKKIAEKIIEKEADYVLMLKFSMVKDNQKTLRKQIEQTFEQKLDFEIDVTPDFGHGRIEKRTCKVTDNLDLIEHKDAWTGLKSLIKITSERINKQTGKESTEDRYYISSIVANAQKSNKAVRKHWNIENNLHWVLDVVFKEDQSLKKKGNAALNFNMMSKVALSLIDNDKPTKKSKILKRHKAALDDNYRAKLLKI